jgi:hypothetical protein
LLDRRHSRLRHVAKGSHDAESDPDVGLMIVSLFTDDRGPGCEVCTAEEIQYCTGTAVLEDHCCCDMRHFGNCMHCGTLHIANFLCLCVKLHINGVHIFCRYILSCFYRGWRKLRNEEPQNLSFIHSSVALQPFVGPWPLFQFLNLFTQSV